MKALADHLNQVTQAKRKITDGYIADPDTHMAKWELLRVKQVRMTDEMLDDLLATARRLQDQRPEKRENITANTVVRACVHYVLSEIKRRQLVTALRVSDEEELVEALYRHLS